MDKILEFKKGKFDDSNSNYYRFQCDCLTPHDAMDIEVEDIVTPTKELAYISSKKWITITMHLRDMGIWQRIKDAVAILKGDYCWREFIVREEDHKNLSDIFNPDKKFDELP